MWTFVPNRQPALPIAPRWQTCTSREPLPPPHRLAKPKREPGTSAPGISLKIRFEGTKALGPGKVRLLELIHSSGSIWAAGHLMKMSYGRAWKLASELNGMFDQPLILAHHGGSKRGGASLTPLGHRVVNLYRSIEAEVVARCADQIASLEQIARKGEPSETAPNIDENALALVMEE